MYVLPPVGRQDKLGHTYMHTHKAWLYTACAHSNTHPHEHTHAHTNTHAHTQTHTHTLT
jgi:hypothetical protein